MCLCVYVSVWVSWGRSKAASSSSLDPLFLLVQPTQRHLEEEKLTITVCYIVSVLPYAIYIY